MLSLSEQNKVDELESKLRHAMEGSDYEEIRESIDELNEATMHLAELMMDAAVGGTCVARIWKRRTWAKDQRHRIRLAKLSSANRKVDTVELSTNQNRTNDARGEESIPPRARLHWGRTRFASPFCLVGRA